MNKPGPVRTCIGCRTGANPKELVRYVAAPDGALLVDYRHRLPGRGCYTCLDANCILLALRRKAFARALKREILPQTGEEVLAAVAEQLRQKIINLLGMARKSSQLVVGSSQFELAASRESLALVFLASDLAASSEEKLGRIAGRHKWNIFRLFDGDTLGRLTGKVRTGVIAIRSGDLAEMLGAEMDRYLRIVGEN